MDHRVCSLLSDPYVRLVKACSRDNDGSEKRQLDMILASTPQKTQVSGLLGKVITPVARFTSVQSMPLY